jgi:hypothetical protein
MAGGANDFVIQFLDCGGTTPPWLHRSSNRSGGF